MATSRDDTWGMLRSDRGVGNAVAIVAIVVAAGLAVGFPLWMLTRGAEQPGESAGAGVSQAEDLRADALLVGAIGVAHSYFASNGSFEGFTPQVASQLEPSYTWTADPTASPAAVSIRGATATSVVLVTQGGSGRPLCLATEGGEIWRGTTDARSAADCTGAP